MEAGLLAWDDGAESRSMVVERPGRHGQAGEREPVMNTVELGYTQIVLDVIDDPWDEGKGSIWLVSGAPRCGKLWR